jgi:TPP-dependent pyruvate/acetoin dehydrogenase alpha subunit
MDNNLNLYRTMLLIRRFEERLLEEFSLGRINGTTHTYIGQEADAAGIFSVINADDVIFSNHRCHGHFLAYGGDPYKLAAELMGKATGLVGGRGGSQHIYWRNFYSNGIQGGILPVATGMAFAEKNLHNGNIVVVFAGDGTLGEGVFYESMNMASLWRLPILFVVENNQYAQTTPISLAVAGSIPERIKSFGISVWERETTDVLEIQSVAREAIEFTRKEGKPAGLVITTYRFSAHSKGDDVRDAAEILEAKEKDPLLLSAKKIPTEACRKIEDEVNRIMNTSFEKASSDPYPQFIQ